MFWKFYIYGWFSDLCVLQYMTNAGSLIFMVKVEEREGLSSSKLMDPTQALGYHFDQIVLHFYRVSCLIDPSRVA